MTYCFLEVLVFFLLTLVNIYCLEFISHYIKGILYKNKRETNHKRDKSRCPFSRASDIYVKKYYFFHVELKYLINDF